MRTDLSQLLDAPTQIMETQSVIAEGTQPGYCQVSGYVTASVEFLLRLPDDWNGKFIELGCGAFCGVTRHISWCKDPLRRGYACIVSDGGHTSSPADAKWAYNNLHAEIDFGFRAPHVTALAGKAIVERYYDQPPRKSYFMGHSTGGRQALMAAQRFPWDFDGIIAGAPPLGGPAAQMNLLWGNRAITDTQGDPLLGRTDLDLLHQAVVSACDLNDGVKDGLIGDPRDCDYDPAALRCAAKTGTACLTPKQIEAVTKIYGGPVTSTGKPVFLPGAMRGSERTWLDWFSGLFRTDPRATYNFVREAFRYTAFDPDPGATWNPEDFDFDRDYKRLGIAEALYAPANPDLRRFQAAGGKLLMYAGWNDAGAMVLPVLDYYETAERTMGGRAVTQRFFRLFVVPGMGHGPNAADGAFVVDWLGHLEAWVEQGRAPDKVISSHIRMDDLDSYDDAPKVEAQLRRLDLPLDPAEVAFSRPVYPYPAKAKYRSRGNPRNADSFERADH